MGGTLDKSVWLASALRGREREQGEEQCTTVTSHSHDRPEKTMESLSLEPRDAQAQQKQGATAITSRATHSRRCFVGGEEEEEGATVSLQGQRWIRLAGPTTPPEPSPEE